MCIRDRPIITESIKATAALSASSTHHQQQHNELYETASKEPVKQQQQQQQAAIRMIDTDNEDIDVSNDSSEPIRLDKLDEEDKQLDSSILNVYEKNVHPPSFKTAISAARPLYPSANTNVYSSHPYQNDMDLNIHPNTLPKIHYPTQH